MSEATLSSFAIHLMALFCVVLIAGGQVLFKLTAVLWDRNATFLSPTVVLSIGAAVVVYGLATILWIFLLRHEPLSHLYPYMGLSFVLVAVAGHVIYGETLSLAMLAGLILIVSGVALVARSD